MSDELYSDFSCEYIPFLVLNSKSASEILGWYVAFQGKLCKPWSFSNLVFLIILG